MRRGLFILLFCWVALATLYSHYAHADIHVGATLDNSSFSLDQGAVLSVAIEGASRGASVELPEISGVDIQSRGQSTQINMINGNFSSSVVYNYQLTAGQPGNYTLGPVKVTVSGATYTTEPIHFQVTASEITAPVSGGNTPLQEVAFLQVSPLGKHYPGEAVPVSIKAYFIDRYQTSIDSAPELGGDGVVMEPLNDKPRQTRESVNGQSFNVLTWKTTLSGIKTGEHPLHFNLDATMMIPQKGKRRSLFDDPFFGDSPLNDSFFGGILSNVQPRRIKLKTGSCQFTVLPLPSEGRPAAFAGAIGSFDLKVTANPLKVEAGEPITLTTTISGNGNFDRIAAPDFPDQTSWKTYTPTSQFYKEGSSTSGAKIFEQAIIARDASPKAIPSLTFCYFDPQAGTYIEKSSAPIQVELSQAPPRTTPPPSEEKERQKQQPPGPVVKLAKPVTAAQNAASSQLNLAPLKMEEGSFKAQIKPVFLEKWFISAAILIAAILFAIICHHLWIVQRERHPEKQLLRQREQNLAGAFARIEHALNVVDTAAFLAECKAAIQLRLGEKWCMPASAVSLANLEMRLTSDSSLIALFRLADEAQYGFGAKTLPNPVMQDYFVKLQKELRELC